MICSEENYLNEELAHLTKVFTEYNQYSEKIAKEIIQEEIATKNQAQNEEDGGVEDDDTTEEGDSDEFESATLSLPYIGEEGIKIMKKMKKDL